MKNHGLLVALSVAVLACAASPALAARGGPDFNGDGFDDLATSTSGVDRSGDVHILYGSCSGLTGQRDQIINQDVSGMADEVEAHDRFGSLAWGDFNGDGFDDLAIGAIGESINDIQLAGAFHVLYGARDGLQPMGSQFFTEESPGFLGEIGYQHFFGFVRLAGDFNGDGFDDLIADSTVCLFGSPTGLSGLNVQQLEQWLSWGAVSDFNGDGYDDVAAGFGLTEDNPGAVKVVHGSASGLDFSTLEIWTEDTPGIHGMQHDYDHFGSDLTAGDFNGDGFGDLACGTHEAEAAVGFNNEGAVHIIYGSIDGLTANGSQFWHQDSPGVNDRIENGDYFGMHLVAADFNGDGRDDLAIGATGERAGGFFKSGAVYIMYGSDQGLTTLGDQTWHQDSAGIKGTAESRDRFGQELAHADFNGDGRADLAIGVPFEDLGAKTDAGSINILFGRAAGLRAQNNQSIHRDAPGINGDSQAYRSFGGVMTSGR